MFRVRLFPLTLLLVGASLQISPAASVTLNFGINSIVGETGNDLNLQGFSIRIGKFQSVTPTFGNYGLWNADFLDLTGITTGVLAADGNAFVVPPAGEFGPLRASGDGSETYGSSYGAGLNPGDQISVWIYNSTNPGASTQAILVTQSTWILPAFPGVPGVTTFGWINGEGSAAAGSLTIRGGVGQVANNLYVDGASEKGVRLVTTNVVPEPTSLLLIGAGALGLYGRRRRTSGAK